MTLYFLLGLSIAFCVCVWHFLEGKEMPLLTAAGGGLGDLSGSLPTQTALSCAALW